MSDWQVPYKRIRREIMVVNSRFIATLAPAFSVEEARDFIAAIRHEFADATHNVPAYIIGGGNSLVEYCSDDGEPSGTAGRPALTVLRGSGLGDAVLVITRYFGGTKLGTGGLVRAYTQAAQSVTTAVPRARRETVLAGELIIPYALYQPVKRLAEKLGLSIQDEQFGADVQLSLYVRPALREQFASQVQNLSSGQAVLQWVDEKEVLIPLQKT